MAVLAVVDIAIAVIGVIVVSRLVASFVPVVILSITIGVMALLAVALVVTVAARFGTAFGNGIAVIVCSAIRSIPGIRRLTLTLAAT
jgi:hypothetical protein